MRELKQKIKNTKLFSDEEKVDILVSLDTYSEDDTINLGKIIDEFDETYARSVATYKKSIFDAVDVIAAKSKAIDLPRIKSATAQIKSGLDTVLSA